MNNCRHHWYIETPSGPTCHAYCIRCGAERDYDSYSNQWDNDGIAWSLNPEGRLAVLDRIPSGYAERGNRASRRARR